MCAQKTQRKMKRKKRRREILKKRSNKLRAK